MSYGRRNFTFRTPNLLKRSYQKNGTPCWDSVIHILANSKEEANNKLTAYISYGQKIGWYK